MRWPEQTARILPWPLLPARPGPEVEFLPAALEIIETPASPAGRMIGGTIIAFFALALLWASVGKVDIIATAQGKIMPSARSKVIQPFETGVVRAIHVEDGQSVKAGQPLIDLDPTIDGAERDRLQKEFVVAALGVARLMAILAPHPETAFNPPAGASPDQVALQKAFLANQIEEMRSKLANLDRQIAEAEANCAAVKASVTKLSAAIPLLAKRVDARKYLADRGYGSKLQYLQEDQDLIEHRQELKVQQARLKEASAALEALREQRLQTDAQYKRDNLNDLAQAQQKAASLEQQRIQAEQRRDLETLKAPVDGTIQQLAIHTIGGVVTPAQALAVVVPAGGGMEIEASIPNRDIGFVHAGQEVEVKVDTFNFTKYGLLRGHVVSVSHDAVTRQTPSSSNNNGGAQNDSATSEPKGEEYVYVARIALDRTQIQIEDGWVDLEPGMAVTAEIMTGRRRVIEYLLSPVLRYEHEAIRER